MRKRKFRVAAALAALAPSLPLGAAGCGNGSGATAMDAGSHVMDAISPDAPPGAPVDSGIRALPLLDGGTTTLIELPEDGGASRDYRVHVPPSYDGKTPIPLILNFHGFTSNAVGQEIFSQMDAKADAAGFLVVYPDGLHQSWNAGTCCGQSLDAGVDDIGFTRRVVADVSLRVRVDAKRVYVTGMSNGGFMAHRLACEAADLFAAFAPVSGVLGIPPVQCAPSRPISMMEFHGTADTLVPYEGGLLLGTGPVSASAPDTFAGWAARDGCTGTAAETYDSGAAHCGTYSACRGGAKVTLCTIDGEGHCWPGNPSCPYGTATTDINADDAMWSFFQGLQLP